MITNSDCTIYTRIRTASGITWKRQYVEKCWWFEETKSVITTDGLKSADVLKVRIPDLTVFVNKDDIIVKGDCQIPMQTVKDLATYHYFKVITANYNRFGNEPHIKVVGA